MGNEMQDFEKANLVLEPTEAPTLTLDPDLGETEPTAVSVPEPEKKQEVKAKMPALSPEEQKMVDDLLLRSILPTQTRFFSMEAGTQKKMADFSDAALENVRTQDLGEVGDLITQVVGELRDFDAAEEEKGFLGFFKKQGSKIENMKNRYAKAEVNVQKITTSLQDHQMRLMKDSAVLEKCMLRT